MTAQQGIQLILEVSDGERIGRRIVAQNDCRLQFLDFGFLRLGEIATAEFVTCVLDFFEDIAQLAGGAFGGGCGIIEFMSESGGKLAEAREPVALLLETRDLADAIGHEADETLGESGIFCTEFRKSTTGNRRMRLSVRRAP